MSYHLKPLNMHAVIIRNILIFVLIFHSCTSGKPDQPDAFTDKVVTNEPIQDSISVQPVTPLNLAVTHTSRDSIVNFAKSLLGTPYKYASSNRDSGFDCSGFITYVFNHFNIKVPRSSVDFTNVGREVNRSDAKPGDLILFTGTDSLVRVVGHMGIVTTNTDTLRFIHSSSGRIYGVTETPLNNYYRGRFVKVIDIY